MTFYCVLESFRFWFLPEFSVKLQYFPDKIQNNARLFLLHFLLEEPDKCRQKAISYAPQKSSANCRAFLCSNLIFYLRKEDGSSGWMLILFKRLRS